MGFDRSKKRIQPWKRAALHFSLCFVTGFFTGFAPTSTASIFSGQPNPYRSIKTLGISAHPAAQFPAPPSTTNDSLVVSQFPSTPNTSASSLNDTELRPNSLLIVITTTTPGDRFRLPMLMRLAHTLKLVPSPLLWIVVEAQSDAPHTSNTLRNTGIMYRHLTYKENFTDPSAEADHQRNVALNHIEYHRLDGIVHFADLDNVYDLEFFEDIREIEVFGTWPVVMLSANRRRVVVEGPVCNSSKVVGWRAKDLSNGKKIDSPVLFSDQDAGNGTAETVKPARINISGFAFNSSVLWDPERWGRPSAVLDTSQDSIKFVQEVALEDEAKLKGIPSDCSKILMWHLHVPRTLTPSSS